VLAVPVLLVALAASSSAAGTGGIAAKLARPSDLAAQTAWTARVRITPAAGR